MVTEVKNGQTTKVSVNTEAKANIATMLKTAAEAEELSKFAFFAKNKEATRKELCDGPIFKTVSINGMKIVILTYLTDADVSKYRNKTVFDHI